MTKKITFLITAALMLLTMIVSPGRAVGQTRSTTYEAATSIAVNDVVLLVAESSTYKKELSGFTTSGTIYGTVTDYTSIPNGVYPLTVVAGNSEGSFAFKNSDDQYLSWSSGNSLQLSATLNDNSSWTFNYAYTVTTITNVGTTTRQIKYNSSSPRFACYTSGQQSIKLYKQVSSSLTDSDLVLNNAPVALEFDLYNNYDDQTVSYTTSSTGLVAIDDNQYIDTEIDQNNKTITVTPKKVTPSTQTITVNQAADATYAAGSTTFTISIANSAPYTQPTEIEANLNNSLFGTNYSGSASNITDNNPLIGIVDNVTVTYAGSGNHYVNNSQIRFYPNNKLTFEAPSGYEIKQIVFTSAGTWAATISADGGTYNSSTKTWTGSASSVLFTGSGSSRCDMSKADITIGAASSLPTPTITIDATGITNTNVFEGTYAGSLSASVTYNEVAVEGATVTWSGNNDEVATINTTSGAVTLVAAGSVTFTATFAGNENYNSATAPYVMTVTNDDPNAPGTENNPYTVAQARAAIDAGTGVTGVYATGIVSAIPTAWSTQWNNITFNIVDESGDDDFLQAFRCVSTNTADASTVAVGDIVVVYGNLKLYQSTYEFDASCQLISLEHPAVTVEAPTFSPAAGTYDEAQSVTLSCATDGATIYYTLDGSNPTNASTEYTAAINVASTTTIKAIAYVGEDYSTVASATYTLVSLNNILDITEVGTAYSVKGTVVAINSRGFVMGDGTGYVYYYKNAAPTQAVNDNVKMSGTTGTYGQIIQFTNSATVTEAATSNYDGNPTATVITAIPDYSTGYHLSTYLEFTGALAKSGDNYLITVGEGQIQISYPTSAQSTALTALNGKTVHVKGYFSGINSSSKFTVMLESAEEVAVPAITLAQYEYNLNADGGNAELPVTYTNMPATPQAEVIFYEANGTTTATYDWITAEINSNNNIAGHIDVNEGEARSAYFKVKGIDANDNAVYSDLVTINQAAPAAPSIVFETASMNLIAGGESDRKLSFDYSGLGNAPTFTIYYYEQDGETQVTAETYEWLTATIDENNKLNITVVANEGEARSAYLKVYGEKNENVHAESNLVTITQAEYVVDYATLPFEFDGGRADIANTNGLTQDGLDSDYGSSPKLKFNGTGDWVILKINETPGVLSFDIKGNSFSGSTFTVQTSEDGITYTDLETYTELGDTQYESFNNLGENVRYIKWIYTEKSSGNVGLGNITLAKHVAPQPSITVNPATVNATAAETDGTIDVTLTAIANNDIEVVWFESNGNTAATYNHDWIQTEITTEKDVYYLIGQNTGDARSAYFKVYGLDGEANDIYSELITISQAAPVTPPATENYELYSGTLVEGDYLIVYDGVAMNNTLSGKRFGYEEVTISNNTISNSSNSIVWHIAPSATEGYWTLFNVEEEKYASNGGSSMDMSLSTTSGDDNTLWSVTAPGETTHEFRNKNNESQSSARYLRRNGTYGFACYSTSTGGALSLYKKASTDPSITANDVNIASDATAGEITFTLQNPVLGGELTASTESDWLTLGAVGETVPFTCEANTEATARTATVTLTYTYNTKVTITATAVVTQAALIIDYATMPFAFDGGRTDIENVNGLTQEGLDSDYGSSPKLKFNTTGDWMILKLNAAPVSIIYDIKGNGSGQTPWAGTFKVQVSGDGTEYEDLKVYENNLGDVQTDTLINNNTDVRYIKWIYTDKSSGNVALGNIKVYDVEFIYVGSTTINNLTIYNNQAYVVKNGKVLTLTGTVNNTNPDHLIIQDGGQLIHTNELAATLQKNITAASSWKDDVDGWYFIASPVDNLSTSAVTGSGLGTYDLFAYDEPNAYWRSNTGTGAPFTELERGKGYLYANKDDVTLDFAGMMVGTNESISLDLSYACTYDDVKGFNLVGNPYTCNIMSGNMLIGSTPVLPIYVINDEGRTKLTAVTTDTYAIKPGEGFFVQATATNQTLTINPTAKDNFEFRYIKIVAGNENGYDNTFIQLEQGNTLRKMDIAETTSVYVMNNGDDYAAARVEELAGTMPVHFKAVEDGEFTITINAKNIEASTMMLFDNQTGELIDLLETPTYAFKASAEDDDNRFKLIFDFNNNYNGVDDNYVNGNFAYQNGDELFVSGDGTLQVFDVMGRFVMSKEIHGNESISVSAFETGVYMLRFVGENIMTQKIVVR